MEKRFVGRFDLVGRLRKTLPHWPQLLRAGPASFEELRALKAQLRERVDLDDVKLGPAQRPPAPPDGPRAVDLVSLAEESQVGRPFVHDWPKIIGGDAEDCRTFCKKYTRAPTRKERESMVEERLGGVSHMPHPKTLWKHLPKNAPTAATPN